MLERRDLRCRFCGNSEQQIEGLSAGFNVFICNECLDAGLDVSIDALLQALVELCKGPG
jgi:ATP-dependent protease Clp ATPase subunit